VALISIDKCCQAALESGLTRKTVSALCEEYVPQIRAASTGAEIARLSNTLMYHFVRLVRRLNGKVTYSEPVQACCTYIEKHAFDKITLELLARQVGYSPDHLSKKFKLEVGELPKDYILRTKIYHAQLMLTTTSMPIGEIAGRLSFCSNSHFTKVFRRFTQQTPASYRFMHNHMV
jgi:AraC-like DNA-binding protein